MASRREQRHELRRKAIVEAAAQVFAEVGIAAATLDQIGDRLGLSKASLYYYIEGKDQLITAVLKVVLDDGNARAAKLIDPASGPLEQLKMRAQAHVESAMLTPAGRVIISNLDIVVSVKAAAILMRRHERPAQVLFQQARDQGLIRDINVTTAVKLLYGALNNIPRWYRPKHGSLEDVLDQTWNIFTRGIVAREN